jgi:hypothetical protein
MRSSILVAAVVVAATAAGVTAASAQDGYRHGRILSVEPGTTLQRADAAVAEEAFRNLPFLPGDRVWTDATGRAELQFPVGTLVRLDRRGKLDYAAHEEEPEEHIVLRLWSGSVFVHARPAAGARFELETPAGLVRADDGAVVRVDVDSGVARLSVFAGQATLDDGRQRVRLDAGEQTVASWQAPAEEPWRFDTAEADEFAEWDGEREAAEAQGAETAEYLPEELRPYEGELERNGTWRSVGVEGFVWVPYVDAGWRPYSNGYWAWTPYGWTWIPNEGWGWAPSHYGRWGYSAATGWYWAPGRRFSPGWVSWAVGDGYVAWSPLGRDDRPLTPWGSGRGHAVPREGLARGGSTWSLVRRGDLGRPDLGRRQVSFDRIDPTALRVTTSAVLRPTRDAKSLAASAPPRAISRRQSMGDFVRELGVDNQTSIPAPWTRGYGPPPAGVEGARYRPNAPEDHDGKEKEKESRSWNPADAVKKLIAAPRPAPGHTPPTAANATGGDGRPSNGGTTSTVARRPRPGGAAVSGAQQGKGVSGTQQEQTAPRPAPGSGSSARPAGGTSKGASPAGASHAGSGGHAVPRRERK